MKKVILLTFMFLGCFGAFSQTSDSSAKIYNPNANAISDIKDAVKKAKNENKNVLIQVGGNWCPWCLRLHKFFDEELEVKKLIEKNYVFILVNYSKENKNEETLKKLNNPERFGFPVLVVLNQEGQVIHLQDSGYLEDGKSYSADKVSRFLKLWSIDAIKK